MSSERLIFHKGDEVESSPRSLRVEPWMLKTINKYPKPWVVINVGEEIVQFCDAKNQIHLWNKCHLVPVQLSLENE